jgi:hypothetical protein
MRTIDALAISLGLIACLAIGQMGQQPSLDELAADTWMLEQDMVGLLHTMSSPAEACYNMTLPNADANEGILPLARDRAHVMLATSCDPSMIAQLT